MTQIDYKKVKCPKCGKSYFRVKEDTDFNISFLVFTKKPDPIYKDGKLQNPTETDPIKVQCECLECGCNFSVNTLGKKYEIIDEDKLREEREKVLSDYRKRCEDKKANSDESLVIVGDGTCTLTLPETSAITIDRSSPAIERFEDIVKEELDEIKERLAKLEGKK